MNRIILFYILFLLILLSSCLTKNLWKATDPNEYIQVHMYSISEKELKEKGVKYYKDEKTGYYYLEKTTVNKLKDYSIRILGTPVTVIVDAGTSIVIVGTMIFVNTWVDSEVEKCKKNPNCRISEEKH